MRLQWIVITLIVLVVTACEQIAVQSTPKRQAHISHTPLATQAENDFWMTLHKGNYQNIPAVDYKLMAAYLENPYDPKLAAHLGFLHMWAITERQRLKTIPPTNVNHIVLAKYYFKNAIELDPTDARYLGFYGDAQLASGQIFKDQREQVHGYFTVKRAIHRWPEFNYFTGGFVMSTLPPDLKQFKQGLAWQWSTLDLCAGEKVDRHNPDFKKYMLRETQTGPQRACWNSWIAPYNFEGFFLNMGDMLVKSGDWQTAIKIYQNAKLDKHYAAWPYKTLLENHIEQAKNNVMNFQNEHPELTKNIMFNSGRGCVMCHQGK